MSQIGALTAALALSVALVGCADDSKGMGDAPVKDRRGDDTAAEVFNFPDQFGNVATKCVGHGYRAYVTTNKGAPSQLQVVPDSACGSTDAAGTTPPTGTTRPPGRATAPTTATPVSPSTSAGVGG